MKDFLSEWIFYSKAAIVQPLLFSEAALYISVYIPQAVRELRYSYHFVILNEVKNDRAK